MFLCPLPVPFWLYLHVKKQNPLYLSILWPWHQKYFTWAVLAEHDHQFFCICSDRLIAGASLSMCRWKWEREIFPILPHQSIVAFFPLLPESPGDFAKTSGMSMSEPGSQEGKLKPCKGRASHPHSESSRKQAVKDCRVFLTFV